VLAQRQRTHARGLTITERNSWNMPGSISGAPKAENSNARGGLARHARDLVAAVATQHPAEKGILARDGPVKPRAGVAPPRPKFYMDTIRPNQKLNLASRADKGRHGPCEVGTAL
jgi:hypothetical protein